MEPDLFFFIISITLWVPNITAVELTADNPNRQAGIIDTEAEVLWKLKRYDEAIAAIDRSLAIDPESQYYKDQKKKFIESKKTGSQSA